MSKKLATVFGTVVSERLGQAAKSRIRDPRRRAVEASLVSLGRLGVAAVPILLAVAACANAQSGGRNPTALPNEAAATTALAPYPASSESGSISDDEAMAPPPDDASDLLEVTAARYVTLGSWSPDGRWLAIWVDLSTPEAGVPAPAFSTLRLIESSGQHVCDHPEARQSVETDGISPVLWLDDGRVQFRELGGTPCEGPFEPLPEPVAEPTPGILGGPISPGGLYLAETEEEPFPLDGTDQQMVTSLMRRSDGAIMSRVPWQRSVRSARDVFGQWLPDDSFLIRETADRGPLRLQVDGTVTEVAPDVFGVTDTNSDDMEVPIAFAVVGDDPSYHLALWTRDHGLQLYHPETGELESLRTGQRVWS